VFQRNILKKTWQKIKSILKFPASVFLPQRYLLPRLGSSLAVALTKIPYLHCNENPIYVFPKKELRGVSPNVHIYESVSDLYIPRIGPHIFL
jgi:hypothetical protein